MPRQEVECNGKKCPNPLARSHGFFGLVVAQCGRNQSVKSDNCGRVKFVKRKMTNATAKLIRSKHLSKTTMCRNLPLKSNCLHFIYSNDID